MPRKVLIIDDDDKIRTLLKRFLTTSGYVVVVTDNGSEGLILVRESQPDVIIVDSDMPGLNGHGVCRVLKQDAATRQIPVIIMSGARVEDKDVVSGFAGGADDYVLKPFSLPVLHARLEAVLRRFSSSAKLDETLKKRGIELDPSGRTVKMGGKKLSLTRKEFDLLAALLSKPGRVLSIPYLLETVWGHDVANYNDPGTVEVHVSHLRKKLGPKTGKLIVTVLGHGYKFEE